MKLILPVLLMMFSCQKSQPQSEVPKDISYEPTPTAITITGSKLPEASGLTYSNTMKGKYWVNQDSGNPPYLYLLGADGAVSDSVFIEAAVNRDWEEVVLGAGPEAGKSYLYIGDIGDNEAKYPGYTIYRFEEPAAGVKSVSTYDRIQFTYSDGARDAEAFLVDKKTKDIYVISKRDTKSRVYKLAYPQSTSGSNVAEYIMELPYTSVVSAAISPTDEEVIIKTYTHVHHYEKNAGSSLIAMLQSYSPKLLGYQLEPQGEAISFGYNNDGFYTLSEEARGIVPKLFFYKKK